MSTFKLTDPCTNYILDFIAGGVPTNTSGESLGNYDAVIGNARSTKDLNVLTLTQIYQLQDQLLRAGKPSSAVGRYQFIKSTLQAIVNQLKLSLNTIFSEVLEDKLAVQLLVNRGYKHWWLGTLTDTGFAHNISLEWASLPDPSNAGKSHYDGVGPNHASTSLSNVIKMLQKARSMKR